MKKVFLLIAFACVYYCSISQARLNDHNTIGWYSTTITPAVSKK